MSIKTETIICTINTNYYNTHIIISHHSLQTPPNDVNIEQSKEQEKDENRRLGVGMYIFDLKENKALKIVLSTYDQTHYFIVFFFNFLYFLFIFRRTSVSKENKTIKNIVK